jgi:predicted nucleic acid-binding protein
VPGLKLLLDTNVFIPLEDPHLVPPAVALFSQKAQLHGLTLYVSDSSIDDIKRDTDITRRDITLSKLAKFPRLHDVAHSIEPALLQRFGPITKPNDQCDVLLLDILDLNIVDFLVTEDAGIHRRAKRAGIHRRVFTVQEALNWIGQTFDPKDFRLPYIESRKAHEISRDDSIFMDLRQDYPGFDTWFVNKCVNRHRDCWTVEIEGQLAGLVIRKDERHSDAKIRQVTDRILKICTFKMKAAFLGEKFGEQLLKKILWFAQVNGYEAVYLTAFQKQEVLIALLTTFGFETTGTNALGECILERPIYQGDLPPLVSAAVLSPDMRVYPRFYDGPAVSKYVVPIKPAYHTVLFPEIADVGGTPLFPDDRFLLASSVQADRTPGNTIRKVYISRSPTRSLGAGDILLFYLSKSPDLVRSQSVTTIGIVEKTVEATSFADLARRVGRRSVYSSADLQEMQPSDSRPVLVIDFLLIGHFHPHVDLDGLNAAGVFNGKPSQSLKKISESAYQALRRMTEVSYEENQPLSVHDLKGTLI